MRPAVITLGFKSNSDFDFKPDNVLEDYKIKNNLFPELDIFVGFENLKHIGLVERKFRNPCEVIKKFPHLETMLLERNDFFSEGTDECLAYGGLKGVYLRDSLMIRLPTGPGKPRAEIVRTKTNVFGVEYWNGSFKPLTKFPYLKYLHFKSALAVKGSGIENLGSNLFLTHLLVEAGGFHDIQQLRNLKELRSLRISGQVSDISFLRDLQWIKHLSLENNKISDLSPLQTLTYLESADISGNRISTLPDLRNLKNLRTLNLSSNKLESLESFSGSAYLESLNLSNNSLSEFSQLKKLPNLRALNISANKFVKTLTLPSLPKLRVLSVDGFSGRYRASGAHETFLKVSSVVSKSTRDFLTIASGKYSDSCDITPTFEFLDNLEGFDELEVLTMRNQNLIRVPVLSSLKNLRYLNIFGNNLTALPDFDIPFLKVVNVTDNQNFQPVFGNGKSAPEIIQNESMLDNLACFVKPGLRTEPYPPL